MTLKPPQIAPVNVKEQLFLRFVLDIQESLRVSPGPFSKETKGLVVLPICHYHYPEVTLDEALLSSYPLSAHSTTVCRTTQLFLQMFLLTEIYSKRFPEISPRQLS